jgi:hypothetical protein
MFLLVFLYLYRFQELTLKYAETTTFQIILNSSEQKVSFDVVKSFTLKKCH